MFKHWIRHTAYAPKGLLRYWVLEMLSEKPMSGSEIMDKVEEETHGTWRPSPGSIYPLLTWLSEKGFIKALTKDENGVKKYELTDKGRKLLEERGRIRERFFARVPFIAYPFMPRFMAGFEELRDSVFRLFQAFREFMILSVGGVSKENVEEAGKILREAAERLEAVNSKIRRID
ncbi:MAG: PadR family transcriptional regulator [Thermoproteota archaeon]